MKIHLRFLLLTAIVLVLLSDRAFTQFAFERDDDPLLGKYQYLLVGLGLAGGLFYFRTMEPLMRTWFLVLLGCLGGLALESYHGWGSWAVYPHVFSKLTVLLPLFAVYGYYRRRGLPPLPLLVRLILLGLAINLAFFNQDALSLSAFLDNERGFSVTSAYLLLPCAMLALNWYLSRGNWLWLLTFLGCVGLIIFLQHRTVWIATAVALVLNLLLIWRKVPGIRLSLHRLGPLVLVPVLALSTGGLAAALENPNVVKKLVQSIEDIQNPTKQGTGSWRMQQVESYTPFVQERPLLGWRLDGFELPVQFYSLDTDAPVWENGTGHHFHSFYLDRLFYFGLAGVLLVLLVPLIVAGRRLLNPAPFTPETAALLAYAGSAVTYGISYDWPVYLYGMLGLVLAAITQPAALPAAAPAPRRRAEPLAPPQPHLLRHVPA
ncbi:hypothetical protein EJV47_15265 [Hymenobacter gummosus]|uniref:O-antigen ligase-related domain-containing protein n=1 Tax=Hymenobacter gummosus TaxID=1776032 RepID=A0A431U1F5_9BACT|nr:O-antigen ligase family protein [Hymenobacter gummosus]RTQ48950.1 hypothetical protein EJV47_15265 [Hymenobacter gummosus]